MSITDSQIEAYLEFLKEAEIDDRVEEYLNSVNNEEEGDEARIREYENETISLPSQEEDNTEEDNAEEYYDDYYERNDYIHCTTPIASLSSEEPYYNVYSPDYDYEYF